MNIFNYIIQMGASVMMPIIFTIIGLCIGMKFGKALKSGLFVGVGSCRPGYRYGIAYRQL